MSTTTPKKSFTLVVEKRDNQQGLELVNLAWDGDAPPDIVVLPGGHILIKVGRYLAPGDRYQYRLAVEACLKDGQLVQTWPSPDPPKEAA